VNLAPFSQSHETVSRTPHIRSGGHRDFIPSALCRGTLRLSFPPSENASFFENRRKQGVRVFLPYPFLFPWSLLGLFSDDVTRPKQPVDLCFREMLPFLLRFLAFFL